MRKAEVETHCDGGWESHPAVNIKVNLWDLDGTFCDVGGTDFLAWWDHIEEERQWAILDAASMWSAEDAFNDARELASEVFPQSVEVWQEGRSGGWLVVHGLPDIEDWDAIALGRWARFHKAVRAMVDDFPYRVVELIHANHYQAHLDHIDAMRSMEAKWMELASA